MIGNPWKSDRTEKDRIVLGDLVEAIDRHHAPRARVGLAAPVEFVQFKREAKPAGGSFQNPHTFRHHLLADPVAGNDSDAISLHKRSFAGMARAMRRPAFSITAAQTSW